MGVLASCLAAESLEPKLTLSPDLKETNNNSNEATNQCKLPFTLFENRMQHICKFLGRESTHCFFQCCAYIEGRIEIWSELFDYDLNVLSDECSNTLLHRCIFIGAKHQFGHT